MRVTIVYDNEARSGITIGGRSVVLPSPEANIYNCQSLAIKQASLFVSWDDWQK
jgi:hypothetical protein